MKQLNHNVKSISIFHIIVKTELSSSAKIEELKMNQDYRISDFKYIDKRMETK